MRRSETKAERDHRVYLSLINGASLAKAALTGGISVSTIHRRKIKEKADRHLERLARKETRA